MKFSVNALHYFKVEDLKHYVEEARYTLDFDEPLECNWLEGEIGSKGEFVVHRGDYIIADGLEELEAEVLLDELQAICGE